MNHTLPHHGGAEDEAPATAVAPEATATADKADATPMAVPQIRDDRPLDDAPEAPPLTGVQEELLVALDRMLTTGTYYPPGHAQYVAVAEQCTAAVAAALQGRPRITIEITAVGITMGEGFVGRERRCARRLYDLLEPLNQALLEIHAGAETADLHAALTTLKEHHKQLAGTRTYQEITIEGMPELVQVTGRSLFVRTKAGNGPERTDSPINEYFDPNTIPDAALVPTPEGQMMEREFLAVIQGLLRGGDPHRLQALREAEGEQVSQLLGTWVPDHAIKTIKEILDALEATNSDAMMLQHLISHAQTALQLTGDPLLVELVFEKLRKENHSKPKSQPLLEKRPQPARKPARFTLSRAELRKLIDSVGAEAEAAGEYEDIVAPARAECLGICIQVMALGPNDELAAGIASTLNLLLTDETLPEGDLRVCAEALMASFAQDNPAAIALIVPAVCAPLRHAHHERLGPLWHRVWSGLDSRAARERAWPHAVNELLMGLRWQDAREKLAFYQQLSSIKTVGRTDLLVRLEELQALQEKILAKDLFHAPAPLLYGVHELLLGSSLSELHGPLMHQRLAYQKAHALAAILMDGYTDYNHANRKAYQAILAQGLQERIVPELRDIALRHLKGTVKRLPVERRDEAWVPEAVRWLGRIGTVKTRPLLEDILKQKKMLFFPVWPAACREAARDALAALADHHHREQEDQVGDE